MPRTSALFWGREVVPVLEHGQSIDTTLICVFMHVQTPSSPLYNDTSFSKTTRFPEGKWA